MTQGSDRRETVEELAMRDRTSRENRKRENVPWPVNDRGLVSAPDGRRGHPLRSRLDWSFAPEGAAVLEAERLAVIADVHLGYEWARGAGGDCVPAHSLAETLARLDRLLARTTLERLIVAGDLVESPAPCRRTAEDVRRLVRWLGGRGVTLVALAGNHDYRPVPALPETCEVAGWTIGHGHRPISAPRTIVGHLHPVLRAGGVTAPCFLVGPEAIVLPAFSSNAAGWNVASGGLPPGWRGGPPRCLAGTGTELLDFGPLPALAARLSRA